MATGTMQFGADNNAGSTLPTQTTLRSQNSTQATLVVRNEGPLQGNGLEVVGGPVGVDATADFSPDGFGVIAQGGTGVLGTSQGTGNPGVQGRSAGSGNGVTGISPQRNGVQGESSSQFASGVYGENLSGLGWGIAGRSNAPPGNENGAAVWAITPPEVSPGFSLETSAYSATWSRMAAAS
jgi:hypothetical protein